MWVGRGFVSNREGERGERRVVLKCHINVTLALNGHFNTV